MERVRDDAEGIAQAARAIRAGLLIVYPTDTCYGLGCDARNEEAVRRIYDAKGREEGKPLPLIVHEIPEIEKYAHLTEEARALFKRFSGVSIALRKKQAIPDIVNREKVALRVPDCVSAQKIARLAGCPLIATSANRSGDPPQYTTEGALSSLGDGVDLVMDAGRLRGAPPSSLVDLVTREFVREGEVRFVELARYTESPLRLKKGAEADLFLSTFQSYFGFGGHSPLLIKHRIPKGYREGALDCDIRRARTLSEARLLSQAKEAVRTPYLYEVDRQGMNIVMEYIDGHRVRDCLNEEAASLIGEAVGRLHGCGIVHGDLTTSNMILRDGQLYFVDFGLGEFSRETEARAVDLHLMKECLKSVHFEQYEKLWSVIQESYSHKDKKRILSTVEEIEKRGRYHER